MCSTNRHLPDSPWAAAGSGLFHSEPRTSPSRSSSRSHKLLLLKSQASPPNPQSPSRLPLAARPDFVVVFTASGIKQLSFNGRLFIHWSCKYKKSGFNGKSCPGNGGLGNFQCLQCCFSQRIQPERHAIQKRSLLASSYCRLGGQVNWLSWNNQS